jgi:hypothetical protein
MDAATKFIGGAIGRRVKRAYEERVVPAVSAKQDAMLREQIAIAETIPDLRACLTDNVVFLAGGNRVVADVQPQPGVHPGAGRLPSWPSYGTADPRAQTVAAPEAVNPALPGLGQVLATFVADDRQAGPELGPRPAPRPSHSDP